MCVIAYSQKHTDIPTKEQLTSMWNHNPDGAGYAYINRGKVYYSKGFMTLQALLDDLEPRRASLKHKEFAIHFRIGTAGKNDAHTTHPFPITTDYRTLRQTEGATHAVLFHNGVLSDGGLVDKHSSDTQDFVIAMAPLLKRYTHSKARDYFVSELTSGSKLLILYGNGHVKRYGNWERDGELYVSNTHYKNTYTSYTSYHDYGHYDGWYDEWRNLENSTETVDLDGVLEEIEQNHYACITPEEMKALKKKAQSTTTALMEFEDCTLGYDDTNNLVWLEPDETTKKVKEYNAIYG